MPWELYLITVIAVGFLILLLWAALRFLQPPAPHPSALRAHEPLVPTRLVSQEPLPAPPAVTPSAIAPEGPKCPYCGGQMNPRLVKQQEIWLCSRFPRCTGARTREE